MQRSDVQAAAGKKTRFFIDPAQGRALTGEKVKRAEKYFTKILGEEVVTAMSADTWAGFAHLYYGKPGAWNGLKNDAIKQTLLTDLKAHNGVLTDQSRQFIVANSGNTRWVYNDRHFNHHRGVLLDFSYFLLYSSAATRQK